MSRIAKSIQKPTIREGFAKAMQILKKGILTLPTEGKVPLKWKPMWQFLGKEFADLDIHFISLLVPIFYLLTVTILSSLVVPLAIANNGLLPVYILGMAVIVGFVLLIFWGISIDRYKIYLWLREKKKSNPIVIKVYSLSSIILFSILLISISMIRPIGSVLMPLAMVAIMWWFVVEIIYLVSNWKKTKQ